MIEYAFLALGTGGTAAVLYAVAPAGRGLHRYVVLRSQLRAEAARAEAAAEDLADKLVGLVAELDAATAERDRALRLLGKAELLVAGLEEQNRRLRARAVTAIPVRVLPLPAAPEPAAARVIPLHRSPLAISPTPKPS